MSISTEGLIDPARFAVRSADLDPAAAERAGLELRLMAGQVTDGTAQINAGWRGLAAGYDAPERRDLDTYVHAASSAAAATADRVARAAAALESFGREVGTIRTALTDVERRAAVLRGSAEAGELNSDWTHDPVLVAANADLLAELQWLENRLEQACDECCRVLQAAGRQDRVTYRAGPTFGSPSAAVFGASGPVGSSVPMRTDDDGEVTSPWLVGRRTGGWIPRVILVEENPLHAELDLAGLAPGVGEPADLVNMLIYSWEKDWENAGISLLGVVPVFGSAGTVARVADRAAGSASAANRTAPRLTQARLEHIVARHWWTAGSPAGAGRFVEGLKLSRLSAMISAAVSHGAARPNTAGRPGTIYEIDFSEIIGINGMGQATSRLRVVVDGDGVIKTAFPY